MALFLISYQFKKSINVETPHVFKKVFLEPANLINFDNTPIIHEKSKSNFADMLNLRLGAYGKIFTKCLRGAKFSDVFGG